MVAALGQPIRRVVADDPSALPQPGQIITLFDGKTLNGWESTPFGGQGEVQVEEGTIVLPMGSDLTGITCTRPLPNINYEIALEAMRTVGHDFFCGLTFPVGDQFCSFIVGGWGGGVVGLSSIDGKDASENSTKTIRRFDDDRWYKVTVRVTSDRIVAMLDQETVVDFKTVGHVLSIRNEVRLSKPLGIASWRTTAALKNIQFTHLKG